MARVFTILKEEGKLTDTIITKLMKWKHSGFSMCEMDVKWDGSIYFVLI